MPRFRRSAGASLVLVTAMTLVACQDQLTGPESPGSASLAKSSTSSVVTGGNPYFTFLEPLRDPASVGAAFDGSLSPVVRVSKGDEVVAEFGPGGRGPEAVGVRGSHYQVNWQTSRDLAAGIYRIGVTVDGQLLGYHDIELVSEKKGSGGKKGGGESGEGRVYTAGSSVPIKFRIEEGALAVKLAPIDAEGGEVSSVDGGATLDFPAGALSSETPITVEPVTGASVQGGVPGTVYEFGPSGIQFEEPVTLTLAYGPAALPPGVSERLLRLHTLIDGDWVQVPGSTVNPASNTVTGKVTHFSIYALLPESFTQVSAGEFHACGLTESGAAWCWGWNASGQLGNTVSETCESGWHGPTACSTVAVEVGGGRQFQSIEAGWGHTCGVDFSGAIYCWGRNDRGQLGDGTAVSSQTPVRVASNEIFASVSAEFMQTCGLTTSGTVYCWGWNQLGNLGFTSTNTCSFGNGGSTPCETSPVKVNLPAIAQVDLGLGHACAVTGAGDLYCWGWNIVAQLGIGTFSQNEPPTLVSGGPYDSVSAGAVHSCAVRAGGAGKCWGRNYGWTGTLGTGTTNDSLVPANVAGGLTFTRIEASNGNNIFSHSCGIVVGGDAVCWGANYDGALGTSAAPNTCSQFQFTFDCALAPVAVSGGHKFSSVTTGNGFTCGYTVEGEVYCWGRGSTGELGTGLATDSSVPVKVATAGDAT